MQEKHFWLVLSGLILLFSGICLLVIGYAYFFVLPHPKISPPAPLIQTKIPAVLPSTESPILRVTNTPIYLVFITPTRLSTQPITTPEIPNDPDSPEQFIRTYYALINERRYATTFSMLSDDFKDRRHCCNPDGTYQIEPYKDWWDSVAEVVILSVDTLDREDDTAVVEVNLQYRMKDGRVVNSAHTFNLVVDPEQSSWLIDR